VELSLNTYSECVDSFIAADQLMGSAFRQKLAAFTAAREQYIARNQHKNNPEWGFITKFSSDTGASTTYIGGIAQIANNPEISSALENFSSVGYDTALALSKSDPEIAERALDHLEQTGELAVSDIVEIADPVVLTPVTAEPDLSNIKIDPASIAIGNTELEQLATFIGLCGSTASLYNNQSGEQLTAETFSGFVVNNFVQQLDSLDPSHRADHYSFLLNNLTELVGLLQQTIELIPGRIPLKSIS